MWIASGKADLLMVDHTDSKTFAGIPPASRPDIDQRIRW